MQEIIITFKDGTSKNFPIGTILYEVAEYYQNKMPHIILGAKIGNEIVAMTSKLTKSCTIEFIDVLDPYGYRMYQAALKFIFEVAVKETMKDVEVEFLHSVPKGIMTEIIGPHSVIKEDLNKIKAAMSKIIGENEKIERYNVNKKEAIQYFKKQGQIEKATNIHNTNTDVVTFQKLKNYYNYYYTELPYNSRKISKFDLVYLGNNKIVLVYPSSRTEGLVPEYVHYENIIATFNEGKKWLDIMHIPYLADLNKQISESKIKEIIEANELVFNEEIAHVARRIKESKEKKIILISGPSSTGKTTTTKRLASYLKSLGFNTIPISVDDYYKDHEETPKNKKGEYDFECLEAIDTHLFNKDLKALLEGEEVHLPIYDFVIGKKK